MISAVIFLITYATHCNGQFQQYVEYHANQQYPMSIMQFDDQASYGYPWRPGSFRPETYPEFPGLWTMCRIINVKIEAIPRDRCVWGDLK